MKILQKGERLPKHKYKEFSYMTAADKVYDLYDDNENHLAILFQPRWKHLPRRLIEIKEV